MKIITKAVLATGLLVASGGAWACASGSNPVANCGFETGNFSGWTVKDMAEPFVPASVVGAGFTVGFGLFTVEPTQGSQASVNGFDGAGPDTIEYSQDITVPANAAQLTFDYRAGWDLDTFCGDCTGSRIFTVQIQPSGGGEPLFTEDLLVANPGEFVADTGALSGAVNMAAYRGQDVRIFFLWTIPDSFTGPAQFQLDNVEVTATPTAIPTLSAAGLATLAVLMLMLGFVAVRTRLA